MYIEIIMIPVHAMFPEQTWCNVNMVFVKIKKSIEQKLESVGLKERISPNHTIKVFIKVQQ